jgi:methionyl-tRNA formyltransferase
MAQHKSALREVWFFGDGRTATTAFRWLQEHAPEAAVVVCSASGGPLAAAATRSGAKWVNVDGTSWRSLEGHPSIVISFLFPWRVPRSVLDQCPYGGVNFHPGPLPSYRGVCCATFAILNGEQQFGVTCHYMSERFDDGPILGIRPVLVMPSDTAWSLEKRSKEALLGLFVDTCTERAWEKLPPGKCEQPKAGMLYTKRMFDRMARIDDMAACDLDRHTRAFWNPPRSASYIERDGRCYHVMPQGVWLHSEEDLQ